MPPTREACEESIRKEREEAVGLQRESELLEPIGDGLFRLHLNAWWDAKDLRTETIAGLFLAVSDKKRGIKKGFLEKVSVLRELCRDGKMPFTLAELNDFLAGYAKAGYPICRHSEVYRETYHPAYRLAGVEAEKFLPLLLAIDRKMTESAPLTIAIDGPSGAGKSSLAAWLQRVYGDCEVFHMDDFFLPKDKKTEERLNSPGGNVDWERFRDEVVLPLKQGKPFAYRPYDCSTGELKEPVLAIPRRLNIVEGVYSHHPALREAFGLTLFLSIGKQKQSERILQRNGEYMHRRFLAEWIPLEDLYFREMNILHKADLKLMA